MQEEREKSLSRFHNKKFQWKLKGEGKILQDIVTGKYFWIRLQNKSKKKKKQK